jgi:hypothetical protein
MKRHEKLKAEQKGSPEREEGRWFSTLEKTPLLLSCAKQMCEEVGSDTATLGMLYLCLSLLCDGVTGGTQDAMNKGYKAAHGGKKLKAMGACGIWVGEEYLQLGCQGLQLLRFPLIQCFCFFRAHCSFYPRNTPSSPTT